MASRTVIQCPRCGNQFEVPLQSVVDPGVDPESKVLLLSGRFNAAQCPRCGTVSAVAAPLVYHDASKELLITYVPMELNLPKNQQEKIVGELLREVTSTLQQGAFKGYLLQPRSALTTQGLIDQVLAADGVTPEMLEQQRAQLKLVESFIQSPEDQLPALIQQNDNRIDDQFFQIMTMMAQRMLQEGRPDFAQQVMEVYRQIMEQSSYGQQMMQQSAMQEQIVAEVAEEIRALGPNAQRSDFLDLTLRYAGDDQRLQALVGLVRPAFDNQFFQDLTAYTSQAPADQRDQLDALRDRLSQLCADIDQQTQMAVQESAELLHAVMNNPNPEEVIRANMPLIDDTFMAVLSANIQEAERQQDIATSGRLKDIYNRVVTILRENMQPELRFINELLSAASPEDARTMLAEHAEDYGPKLLEMMDAVEEVLASRGDNAILERLAFLRQEAEQVLS
jgi:hypothetical protein